MTSKGYGQKQFLIIKTIQGYMKGVEATYNNLEVTKNAQLTINAINMRTLIFIHTFCNQIYKEEPEYNIPHKVRYYIASQILQSTDYTRMLEIAINLAKRESIRHDVTHGIVGPNEMLLSILTSVRYAYMQLLKEFANKVLGDIADYNTINTITVSQDRLKGVISKWYNYIPVITDDPFEGVDPADIPTPVGTPTGSGLQHIRLPKRLQLILAEIQAGNHNKDLYNEANDILDKVFKQRKITKMQYMNIIQMYLHC